MPELILVSTTVPSRDAADALARALVDERLAACVQVSGPIRSTYRWKGARETTEEWRCEAKTTEGTLAKVRDRITDLHPYEVPEIVMTRIEATAEYTEWIRAQVNDGT